jgi:hypothetical protein
MEDTRRQDSTDQPRPRAGAPFGAPYALAAWAFVAGWLSFATFVVLYRAPLPSDAFAALALRLVGAAAGVAAG